MAKPGGSVCSYPRETGPAHTAENRPRPLLAAAKRGDPRLANLATTCYYDPRRVSIRAARRGSARRLLDVILHSAIKPMCDSPMRSTRHDGEL
jgi:hypothetical protein